VRKRAALGDVTNNSKATAPHNVGNPGLGKKASTSAKQTSEVVQSANVAGRTRTRTASSNSATATIGDELEQVEEEPEEGHADYDAERPKHDGSTRLDAMQLDEPGGGGQRAIRSLRRTSTLATRTKSTSSLVPRRAPLGVKVNRASTTQSTQVIQKKSTAKRVVREPKPAVVLAFEVQRGAQSDDAEEEIIKPAAKRLKTSPVSEELLDVVPNVPARDDEGWVDLDAGDEDDPLMVSCYVTEVYDYLREIEVRTFRRAVREEGKSDAIESNPDGYIGRPELYGASR
jgi:G2/mitotic-specific cyclin 2